MDDTQTAYDVSTGKYDQSCSIRNLGYGGRATAVRLLHDYMLGITCQPLRITGRLYRHYTDAMHTY
jgi:hypothetical protein